MNNFFEKEYLKKEQQQLKELKKKILRRRIIKCLAASSPFVIFAFYGGVHKPTKTVYETNTITIDENGFSQNRTEDVLNESFLNTPHLEFIGEWTELKENSDAVYRVNVKSEDITEIQKFIDAYIISDGTVNLEDIDVDLEFSQRDKITEPNISQIDLELQYISSLTSKEVPCTSEEYPIFKIALLSGAAISIIIYPTIGELFFPEWIEEEKKWKELTRNRKKL